MVQWHPIWQQKLCGGILVSPVLQSSSTGIHHGHTSKHHYIWSRLVTGHGNQQHRLREGVNKKNCDIKLLHPCQVTCNNKVTTNADTSGLTILPPFQSVAGFKNLNCKCCSTHSTLAPLSTSGRIQLQAFLLWSDPVIIGSVKFNLQIQWAVILQISEPCMNAYLCRPHTFSDS